MSKRILHVVSNVAHYADPSQPTGPVAVRDPCPSDLRGERRAAAGAPGGVSPLEPRSLNGRTPTPPRAWRADKANEALLATTARPDEIDPADFDATSPAAMR